jgi:tetratricopeptide (TPR) repeat protein
LVAQLDNTNALVRLKAVECLGQMTEAGQTDILAALRAKLKDSARSVRLQAAHYLATTLDTNTPVGGEYLRYLDHISDQPLGQMQAGLFDLERSDPAHALQHYQTAVKWDPDSPGLRHDLAVVLSQLGRNQEAVTQLEQAVALAPKNGDFHLALALALNAVGDTARVLSELELAVKCDPGFARAWYNLGLARSSRGDDAGALAALARAESADPSDPNAPYARATVLARLGRLDEARAACRHALELAPDFTPAFNLLQRLGSQ